MLRKLITTVSDCVTTAEREVNYNGKVPESAYIDGSVHVGEKVVLENRKEYRDNVVGWVRRYVRQGDTVKVVVKVPDDSPFNQDRVFYANRGETRFQRNNVGTSLEGDVTLRRIPPANQVRTAVKQAHTVQDTTDTEYQRTLSRY